MTRRKAILVLGMHRSGTSVVTRILNLLGADVAKNLMPPTTENPSGYWESVRIARFNNKLLQLANSSWQDDYPIAAEWFASESTASYIEEAIHLLAEEFGQSEVFVLKCPRISLLLPFWKKVLKQADIETYALLALREPLAVAESLAARNAIESMKPAAIAAFEKSILLWLRYTFDAEFYSRDLPRLVVSYEDLLVDWKTALEPLLHGFVPGFPAIAPIPFHEIERLLQPDNRRKKNSQSPQAENPNLIDWLKPLSVLQKFIQSNNSSLYSIIDTFKADFNRLIKSYASLRTYLPQIQFNDTWAIEILKNLRIWNLYQKEAPLPTLKGKTILFLSNVPDLNIGQVFRVKHLATSLAKHGCISHYLKTNHGEVTQHLSATDLVVIFRTGFDKSLDYIIQECNHRQIPLVYSVDDILFDPTIMTPSFFGFLHNKPISKIEEWELQATKHLEMLKKSDAAILTTKPLAIAASQHCPICIVLPNMIDLHLQNKAIEARKLAKGSEGDNTMRIGFAAGTSTHDQNIQLLLPVLFQILSKNQNIQLILLGPIQLSEGNCLEPLYHRVTFKPKVPLDLLFSELSQFDINLSPLEVGNPFCESKSELRYILASFLKIPTIASPTEPLKDCIIEGETGYLAHDLAEWQQKILALVHDPSLRKTIGGNAFIHVNAKYGPEALDAHTYHVFCNLVTMKRQTS